MNYYHISGLCEEKYHILSDTTIPENRGSAAASMRKGESWIVSNATPPQLNADSPIDPSLGTTWCDETSTTSFEMFPSGFCRRTATREPSKATCSVCHPLRERFAAVLPIIDDFLSTVQRSLSLLPNAEC